MRLPTILLFNMNSPSMLSKRKCVQKWKLNLQKWNVHPWHPKKLECVNNSIFASAERFPICKTNSNMSMTVALKSIKRPSSNRLKFNFKMNIADVLHCKKSVLLWNTTNVFNAKSANSKRTLRKKWNLDLSRWKTRRLKLLKKVTMHVLQSEKNNSVVVFEPVWNSNFETACNSVRQDSVQNTIDVVCDLRKTLPSNCNKNLKFNFAKKPMILKSVCVKTLSLLSLDVEMNFVSRYRSKSNPLIPSV